MGLSTPQRYVIKFKVEKNLMYLHKSVKKMHKIFQHNYSILDVEIYKETNMDDDYEYNSHVEISLMI